MKLDVAGFDWDDGNTEKIRKHGLLLEEVETFFQQENIYVIPDIRHSRKENRFLAVGASAKERPMVVVFALRDYTTVEC